MYKSTELGLNSFHKLWDINSDYLYQVIRNTTYLKKPMTIIYEALKLKL